MGQVEGEHGNWGKTTTTYSMEQGVCREDSVGSWDF